MVRGVTKGNVALLPGNIEHFGHDAMHVDNRVSAEVADAGLDGQPAVGLDHEESVEADPAAEVSAHRDADASDLRAEPTLGVGLALLPLEELGAPVDGFLQERTGDVGPLSLGVRGTQFGFSSGSIDPSNRYLVETELTRGPR